jgi:hypothetical protein
MANALDYSVELRRAYLLTKALRKFIDSNHIT